jgi:hypothetical protein
MERQRAQLAQQQGTQLQASLAALLVKTKATPHEVSASMIKKQWMTAVRFMRFLLKQRQKNSIVRAGDLHFAFIQERRRLLPDRLYSVIQDCCGNRLNEAKAKLLERGMLPLTPRLLQRTNA